MRLGMLNKPRGRIRAVHGSRPTLLQDNLSKGACSASDVQPIQVRRRFEPRQEFLRYKTAPPPHVGFVEFTRRPGVLTLERHLRWAAVCGSFDDLICSQTHRGWNRQSDRLRGPHVDNQFKLHRLLNRKIAWVGSLQNPVNELCRLSEVAGPTRSVRHQGTFARSAVFSIHRRQTALLSELHDLGAELDVERVRNDHDSVGTLGTRLSEPARDVVGSVYRDRDDDDSEIGGRAVQRIQLLPVRYVVWVQEDRHPRGPWCDLLQQFHALRRKFGIHAHEARDVSARLPQRSDEPRADWVGRDGEDDGDGLRCLARGHRRGRNGGEDNSGFGLDELYGERREILNASLSKAALEGDSLPFYIAQVAHSVDERGIERLTRRACRENANARHFP